MIYLSVSMMKQKLKIYTADAAGNVTIFVASPVEEADYTSVATALLAAEDLGGEQVAFVVDDDTICMCGHEFCGNASRSFALMKALGMFPMGKIEPAENGALRVTINTSGADRPIDVLVDPGKNYTKIKMPLPILSGTLSGCSLEAADGSPVFDMDGITHVIAAGIEPTEENFELIKENLFELFDDIPAAGVMFTDSAGSDSGITGGSDALISMTPVVYVTDVNTTYFEGSCGSGSAALCAAMSSEMPDGSYEYEIVQPRGSILVSSIVNDGKVDSVFIEGPVSISGPYEVEI